MELFFKTRDLPTAALLLTSKEIEFKGLEGDNQRSKYFVFSPTKKAEKMALDFAAGRIEINARLYADSLRHAKDVLFETERRNLDGGILIGNKGKP